MPLSNAENCKNYRKRKKDAALKIIKKTSLTSAERSRMYRLREKQLTQGIKSSVNEVLYTPSTSNSRMTLEPLPQPVTTETEKKVDGEEWLIDPELLYPADETELTDEIVDTKLRIKEEILHTEFVIKEETSNTESIIKEEIMDTGLKIKTEESESEIIIKQEMDSELQDNNLELATELVMIKEEKFD